MKNPGLGVVKKNEKNTKHKYQISNIIIDVVFGITGVYQRKEKIC